MKYAPIILIVYNRKFHTERTVKALSMNTLAKESELFVFADGYKNDEDKLRVSEVVDYIEKIKGFKNIHIYKSSKNQGLAKSVLNAVTSVLKQFDSVIVLEDDIVTSPYFLKYMNEALEYYKDIKDIGSISGFNYPKKVLNIPKGYNNDIYFSLRPSSWGWATWKDRWEKVDWEVKDYQEFEKDEKLQKKFNKGGSDLSGMLKAQMEGKVDSWAIRWSYHHFKNNLLAVYPVVSFVDNIGNDGSGIHSKASNEDRFRNSILNDKKQIEFVKDIELNTEIIKRFQNIFSKDLKYIFRKIKFKILQKFLK